MCNRTGNNCDKSLQPYNTAMVTPFVKLNPTDTVCEIWHPRSEVIKDVCPYRRIDVYTCVCYYNAHLNNAYR